jgi:hypothetical protein
MPLWAAARAPCRSPPAADSTRQRRCCACRACPARGRFFLPRLAALGVDRSIYAPDLPGCGESDAPPPDAGAEQLARRSVTSSTRCACGVSTCWHTVRASGLRWRWSQRAARVSGGWWCRAPTSPEWPLMGSGESTWMPGGPERVPSCRIERISGTDLTFLRHKNAGSGMPDAGLAYTPGHTL